MLRLGKIAEKFCYHYLVLESMFLLYNIFFVNKYCLKAMLIFDSIFDVYVCLLYYLQAI